MKNKLRKYKDEVNRLREKIKSQNKDIEDALKLLAVILFKILLLF